MTLWGRRSGGFLKEPVYWCRKEWTLWADGGRPFLTMGSAGKKAAWNYIITWWPKSGCLKKWALAAISIQVGEMDSILIIKLPHVHIPETPVPTSLRLFFSPLPLTRGSIFVQSNRSRSLLSPEPFLRLVRRQRLCSTISQTSNPSSTVTGQTWEPGFELMTPALFVKNWSVWARSCFQCVPFSQCLNRNPLL